MAFKMKYPIQYRLIPKGTKRRSGQRMTAHKFIVAHGTGNSGSTAAGNVSYYINSANTMSASAHAFVDDKAIIVCVPLNEKAWHVQYNITKDNELYGSNANDAALGVEMCFGGQINNLESYRRYVWFLAYLCWEYKIDPKSKIVGHFILDPARRSDPKNALAAAGKTYDDLLKDVQREYAESTGAVSIASVSTTTTANEGEEVELYQPTSSEIINATSRVLMRLENKGEKSIAPMWREKLNAKTLTTSDAIGLLYVALDRELIQGSGTTE